MAHGFLSGQCKVVTGPGTGPSSVKFAAGGTDSIDASQHTRRTKPAIPARD
jgi:hypothetical protein